MNYRAGVDLGGTNARVEIFDTRLTTVGESRQRIRDAGGPEEIAAVLAGLIDEVLQDLPDSTVDAVGVGLAGQLSPDGRTVRNAPNLQWRDVPFADLLQDALQRRGIPDAHLLLVNDLSAQLWGERQAGAVQGFDDVLAVSVGTGVGGAILSGGVLVAGATNNAGEIGHSKVVVGGRPCGCGEEGCVEAYAGGIHLEKLITALQIDELLVDGRPHLGVADDRAPEIPEVLQIWEEATDHLSLIIANAATLLNPAALLLGGGVLENCDNFRAMTLQKALPLILQVAREDLQVEMVSLGDQAGTLGAADLASRAQ